MTNVVSRIIKAYPSFVLGTGNEAFSKAMTNTLKVRKTTGQTYFQAFKKGISDGFVASEKHNAELIKEHGSFWKALKHQLKTTIPEIKNGWIKGGEAAAEKGGLAKFLSKFKGALSGVGKRMPLIGSVLLTLTTIPNILSAFSDKGIFGGVLETGKSAVKIGAGTGGAAIGAAILSPLPVVGPLLGCILGWSLGEGIATMFVGKSHSEKKAEMSLAQANFAQKQIDPAQLEMLRQMLYNNNAVSNPADQDFMAMSSGLNKINYNA